MTKDRTIAEAMMEDIASMVDSPFRIRHGLVRDWVRAKRSPSGRRRSGSGTRSIRRRSCLFRGRRNDEAG